MAEVNSQYPTDLPEPDWAKPKQQTTKPAKVSRNKVKTLHIYIYMK